MVATGAAGIFPKLHIQDPVLLIFDPPMTADGGGEPIRLRKRAEEITAFGADLIADDPQAALDQLCATREQLREAWSSLLATADAVLALDGAALVPALGRLAEQCRTLTATQIALRVIGDLAELEPAVACAVYRAVQEGLTNACKHARAQHVEVLVYRDDAVAQVRVRDDGLAAAPPPPSMVVPGASGHFGLIGLSERAELLGGSVAAGPRPDAGFELSMTIPIH